MRLWTVYLLRPVRILQQDTGSGRMSKMKPDLLFTWTTVATSYRLIRDRSHYFDTYTVEVDEKDSLGEPKWTRVYSWDSKSTEPQDHEKALIALADLAVQLDRTRPKLPPPVTAVTAVNGGIQMEWVTP